MSEMIDRVARAIRTARVGPETPSWCWDSIEENKRVEYRGYARAAIEAIEPVDVRCPFCGEDGFDKIGLKIHLHWCADYEETPLADPPAALSPSLKEQEEGN